MSGSTFGSGGPTTVRASIAVAVGLVAAVVVGATVGWLYAPAVGWSVAALGYVAYTWLIVHRMSAQATAAYATREDPGRRATDLVVLAASVASLGGVAYLLSAGGSKGAGADLAAALGILDVAASWLLVHTVFMLRYAELYYTEPQGGVDFNQDEDPTYGDFGYLAFTMGMTYQVSDTDLRSRDIRMTALRHGLLSYLLGAVVLATTINLVAGLGSSTG